MSFKKPFVQSHHLESLMGFDHKNWSIVLYRAQKAYYIIYFMDDNKIDRIISIISDPTHRIVEFRDVEDVFRQHQEYLKDVVTEFKTEKACIADRGEESWTSGVTEH